MSKILFVENFGMEECDNPMSTLYPQRCHKITENDIFDTYDISKNLDETILKKYDKLLLGARSLHLYKCHKGEGKNIIKNKLDKLMAIKTKFFLIQDMHEKTYGSLETLCNYLRDNHINIIFTFFNNAEGRKIQKNVHNVGHYHLPLHIDTNIFHNKNMHKVYDILLYGSIHPRHYPFRKRLFELLQNNDKYKVFMIDKPDMFDPEKCEDGLCDIINKSRLTIATRSRYDYLVAKYLEIINCNSVICGNMATDGTQIYGDNYLKLDEKMTDQEIFGKIDTFLLNYEDNKKQFYQKYVDITKEYNLDNYVEKLISIIDANQKK